tara:strand:+ start:975 stop:1397 length:423 start_codon:yes stop_codon:yes gene_type:complete
MINFFKKEKDLENNNISIISLTSLLIHAAKIDENYSDKEKKIIKESLIKLGANNNEIDSIIKQAENHEKNSNQILEYTKEAKNLEHEKKIILLEALWSIIYSDENADMYESNLMRRLSGLLYLDKKIVGDIKERIKNKKL